MVCFVAIVENPKRPGDLLCDGVKIEDDDVAYAIAIDVSVLQLIAMVFDLPEGR